MAERMVGHFGVDIMHIIDDEPGRLIEVPGQGPESDLRVCCGSVGCGNDCPAFP
jgi:exodeoxyribonuclease V alpha subunit